MKLLPDILYDFALSARQVDYNRFHSQIHKYIKIRCDSPFYSIVPFRLQFTIDTSETKTIFFSHQNMRSVNSACVFQPYKYKLELFVAAVNYYNELNVVEKIEFIFPSIFEHNLYNFNFNFNLFVCLSPQVENKQ